LPKEDLKQPIVGGSAMGDGKANHQTFWIAITAVATAGLLVLGVFNFTREPGQTSLQMQPPAFVSSPGDQPPADSASVSGPPVSLSVPGQASAGVRYTVSRAGWYRVAYISGAYSPWKATDAQQGQWRTLIDLYLDQVAWEVGPYSPPDNGKTPSAITRLGFVGHDADSDDKPSAEDAGKGSTFDIHLSSGHDLVLMPVDTEGQYGGNQGEVALTIAFLHP